MPLKRIKGPRELWRVNVDRKLGLRMRAFAKANRYTCESAMETAIEEFLARHAPGVVRS